MNLSRDRKFWKVKFKREFINSIIEMLENSNTLDEFVAKIGYNNTYIKHIVGSIIKKGWL